MSVTSIPSDSFSLQQAQLRIPQPV